MESDTSFRADCPSGGLDQENIKMVGSFFPAMPSPKCGLKRNLWKESSLSLAGFPSATYTMDASDGENDINARWSVSSLFGEELE